MTPLTVDEAFWRGRRVFLTGHTGFKGAWLALWLTRMGADVTGFSLPAESPSLFDQARVAELVTHVEGDIRDLAAVEAAMQAAQPEVVLHLAAQPLVRLSYSTPVETFATNVQGTVHVLDACRRIAGLKAIVAITSDKCYENRETNRPYREDDAMGGHDPYSASKGATELVVSTYRRSFFSDGATKVASVRAGNVIGGGDWATDRLIPDLVRAMIAGEKPLIRSPDSIRPWQHVLEALGGYLMIAEHLFHGREWAATGWNFGPAEADARPVRWIAQHMTQAWGAPGWDQPDGPQPHEAKLLKLDCTKAHAELGWRPAYTLDTALTRIVEWHRHVADGGDARAISLAQLDDYRDRFRRALSQKGAA
ncbi:CDP-glucose 4,6-dehydratase [Novosphingobium sp. PS1R-30]|uniref:CDP-glucose 4,6-dehydratase n=1 Tax=Novosphingobium anseongense TaxID=3133436 RepID=A0ABU8RVC4_9SPHN